MKLRNLSLLIASISLLSGCSQNNLQQSVEAQEFGVFLGAKTFDLNRFKQYKNVCIEIEEFSKDQIQQLRDENIGVYAYISVGSLETYRDYYNEFKDYTFMDYENWPEERWIDISQTSWQNKLVSLALGFKNYGATGLFMDNFDVYYIACEEYECTQTFKEGIYNGCHKILQDFNNLELDLLINSGTDFLQRMHDEHDTLLNCIDVYCQECVFSSIENYNNDVFGQQDSETKEYYLSIANFMKNSSKILLLEYTKNSALSKQIAEFCRVNEYFYYISEKVNLE